MIIVAGLIIAIKDKGFLALSSIAAPIYVLDTSQKVCRFSRGAFRYAATRVTNVTIGQAVASGSASKYRSDDQENTLRVMTPEETEVT